MQMNDVTWSEIFKRLWLLLRSRFREYRLCEACSMPLLHNESCQCIPCQDQYYEKWKQRNQDALRQQFALLNQNPLIQQLKMSQLQAQQQSFNMVTSQMEAIQAQQQGSNLGFIGSILGGAFSGMRIWE